ncbi:hypothetical protein [Methylobacterium sp. WL120]|uniref:hypothetical protein n=1 Tax=Methylobacterium sp. WL120 TaxID=2603887 RepID=UPI00164FC5FF|nr:hypothetical protein [Methylobacterium sp. WL120]
MNYEDEDATLPADIEDLFDDVNEIDEDDDESGLDDNVDLEEFEAARRHRLAEANEW